MVRDKTTRIRQSLVHHGKFSDRAYLIKLGLGDLPHLLGELEALASHYHYSKILAKVPAKFSSLFCTAGYAIEAVLPRLYQGSYDGVFVSKFRSVPRRQFSDFELARQVLARAQDQPVVTEYRLPVGFTWGRADSTHVCEMAKLYDQVFTTYPFPIDKPEYIYQTMLEDTAYFYVANISGELVALASCEMDKQGQNGEMTDFATLPQYRQQGLASFLLWRMEKEMVDEGLRKAYTIARARSMGMNITFAKLGYNYSGTLVNNTNIAGNLESMNLWHKDLC